MWKEVVITSVKYYPGIYLEELRKAIKSPQSGQLVTGPRSKPGTSKYESGALTT
jgi:hypothetical protein